MFRSSLDFESQLPAIAQASLPHRRRVDLESVRETVRRLFTLLADADQDRDSFLEQAESQLAEPVYDDVARQIRQRDNARHYWDERGGIQAAATWERDLIVELPVCWGHGVSDWIPIEVFPHPTLGRDGHAGYSPNGRAGRPPLPATILIRSAEHPRALVMRTFTRIGEDGDLVLGDQDFAELAGERTQVQSHPVEFRPAGRPAILWHTPGLRLAALAAIAGWSATLVAAWLALATFMRSRDGSGAQTSNLAPLAVVVFLLAALAATVKLLQDLKSASKG